MKNCILHIALSCVFSWVLLACTKDMEGTEYMSGQEILFEAETHSTRSFIDNESLETMGTQLCIYGFHNDNPLSEGAAMKLQGKALTFNENNWKVMEGTTPQQYYWAESGMYKFYAWLAYDAAGKMSIPSEWTYDNTTSKLNIPESIVDKDYNQFDFIYSNVYVRDLDQLASTTEKYAAVPLELNHLFSSFSIGAINTTNEDVLITKVALEGIHDLGSATLDYSGNQVSVAYGATSITRTEGTPFVEMNKLEVEEGGYEYASYLLPKQSGVVGDVFQGASAPKYYMVWPQSKEIVSPTNPMTGDENREYAATDSLLVVEYTMAGTAYKKRVKFPDMDWEAGKKYHFDIQFADKLVMLTATVNPWNYSSTEIDFTEGTVTVKEGGKLAWNTSTCIVDDAEKKVYVSNGQAIEASFTFDTPKGGQWRVSLEGDTQAFTITDDVSPIDDAIGTIDGKQHTIRIIPKITNPERDYVVRLKFVVLTADGKVISADNVIQDQNGDNNPDIYQIVLPNVN